MEVDKGFTDLTTSLGTSTIVCVLIVTILKQITSYYFIIVISFCIVLLLCTTLFDYTTYKKRLEIVKAKRYEEYLEVARQTFVRETMSNEREVQSRFRSLVLFNKKAKRTIDKWGIIQDVVFQHIPECASEIRMPRNLIHGHHKTVDAIVTDVFPKQVWAKIIKKNNMDKNSSSSHEFSRRARGLITCAQTTTSLLINHASSTKEMMSAARTKMCERSERMVEELFDEMTKKSTTPTMFTQALHTTARRAKHKLSKLPPQHQLPEFVERLQDVVRKKDFISATKKTN